jgi:hypothetical protein
MGAGAGDVNGLKRFGFALAHISSEIAFETSTLLIERPRISIQVKHETL